MGCITLPITELRSPTTYWSSQPYSDRKSSMPRSSSGRASIRARRLGGMEAAGSSALVTGAVSSTRAKRSRYSSVRDSASEKGLQPTRLSAHTPGNSHEYQRRPGMNHLLSFAQKRINLRKFPGHDPGGIRQFAFSYQPGGFQAGVLGSTQFFLNIGQKQYSARINSQFRKNVAIGLGLLFAPDGRVKIAGEENREVAFVTVTKDQLLGLDGPGGIYEQSQAPIMPALEIIRGVRIDMAFQFTTVIALLPDHPLQCLECPLLAIFVNPPLQHIDKAIDIFRVGTADLCHPSQLFRHRRQGVVVGPDKPRQVLTGVGKQDIVYERDRTGGALDVRQDHSNHQAPPARLS